MRDTGDDEPQLLTDLAAYPERIPEFASEEEMREFWSTHDSSPYFYQMEDVTLTPPPDLNQGGSRSGSKTRRRPPAGRMDLVSLRLPVEMIDAVKEIAARRHLPYQTLIRSWIGERANEERRALNERASGSQ